MKINKNKLKQIIKEELNEAIGGKSASYQLFSILLGGMSDAGELFDQVKEEISAGGNEDHMQTILELDSALNGVSQILQKLYKESLSRDRSY